VAATTAAQPTAAAERAGARPPVVEGASTAALARAAARPRPGHPTPSHGPDARLDGTRVAVDESADEAVGARPDEAGDDARGGGPRPVDEARRADDAVTAVPRRPVTAVLLFAAGVVIAVAATMRWSTLATTDERRAFTGLAVGDGRITLALGLALAVLGLARLARRWLAPGSALVGMVLAGLVVLVAGGDLLTGPPTLATFRGISADKIAVRPERGLYVSVAAGAVALLCTLSLPRGGGAGGPRRAEPGAAHGPERGGHRSGQAR
jgi:hypothetical protein